MSEDDNLDSEISEAIRKLIEQSIKDGNFPFNGKFSMTITGGRIPLDIRPPQKNTDHKCDNDGCSGCGPDCDCPDDGFSARDYVFNPNGRRVHSYPGLSRIDKEISEMTPHTEVCHDGEYISVYADMPGSDMANTAVSIHDTSLWITSFTGLVKYSTEVTIPKVSKETMKYVSHNGILEIRAKLYVEEPSVENTESENL